MSDGQSLLAVLAILYISDCLWWLPHHAIAWVPVPRGGWRPVRPSASAGNRKGGAVWLPWWPCFTRSMLTTPWPLCVDPEGILAVPEDDEASFRDPDPARVRFENAAGFHAAGTWLREGDRSVVEFPSATMAHDAASFLETLRNPPETGRSALLDEKLRERTDPVAALERARKIREASRRLRGSGATLFLLMFVGAPLATILFGIRVSILPVILTLFIVVMANTVAWFRLHRAHFPLERYDRILHACIMPIAWPMGPRAADLVCRHALDGFHPVAGLGLVDVRSRASAADPLVRRLLHELPPRPGDPTDPVVVAHRERLRRAALSHLPGLELPSTIGRSAPEEVDGHRYCPRCHAWYDDPVTTCPTCRDLPLVDPTAETGDE